jgi:hypothetical protein
LLDWLRVEYGIEKHSNKLLAVANLDSDTWAPAFQHAPPAPAPLNP